MLKLEGALAGQVRLNGTFLRGIGWSIDHVKVEKKLEAINSSHIPVILDRIVAQGNFDQVKTLGVSHLFSLADGEKERSII